MIRCRLVQGTATIYAEIAAREAFAGNVIQFRGSDWRVVTAEANWQEWAQAV